MVAKKVDGGGIEFDDVRRWSAVRLAIPPYIPESRLDGCDMIDIAYELQFKIDIDGGGDLRCAMPMTIGTPYDERRASERRAWRPENYTISDDHRAPPTSPTSPTGAGFGGFNGGPGGSGPMGNLDMDDVNLEEDEMNRFRHPMAPGEIRTNILFTDDAF